MQKLREEESNSEFLVLKKRTLNDRLMLAERSFLDADGLQGRPWFKHLVSLFPSPSSMMLITTRNYFVSTKYNDEFQLNFCIESLL